MSDLRRPAGELIEVGHGTDGEPGLAQGFEIDVGFDSLADVAGGLSVPYDVGDVGGGVVEGGDANAGIVGGGDEGVTGTQTGADDSELAVALLLEPIEAAADVDDALADGVEGAAEVGGDSVIGAADLGGHADIVIGHAQPKDGDAQHVQHAAEADVGDCVGVPVGKKNDGASSAGWKPAGIYQIVFRIWRCHRGGEAQKLGVSSFYFGFELGVGNFAGGENFYFAGFEAEIVRALVGVKLVAGSYDAAVEIHEEFGGVGGSLPRLPAIAARPVACEVEAPIEGTDDAVVVHRGEAVLPVVHPLRVAGRHGQSSSVASCR